MKLKLFKYPLINYSLLLIKKFFSRDKCVVIFLLLFFLELMKCFLYRPLFNFWYNIHFSLSCGFLTIIYFFIVIISILRCLKILSINEIYNRVGTMKEIIYIILFSSFFLCTVIFVSYFILNISFSLVFSFNNFAFNSLPFNLNGIIYIFFETIRYYIYSILFSLLFTIIFFFVENRVFYFIIVLLIEFFITYYFWNEINFVSLLIERQFSSFMLELVYSLICMFLMILNLKIVLEIIKK